MIRETGNRILDRLELRFGSLALPRIVRWIAIFQALSWFLSMLSPELVNWVSFDRGAILGGEIWRIVSWVFYPMSKSLLFIIFATFFLFFINEGLETEWDSFRLNVYVFATVAALALVGLLPYTDGAGFLFNPILYSSLLFAFATIYPEQTIHLLGIIPIKAKWIGWASALLLLGMVLSSSAPFLVGAIVGAGLLPYFLAFAPGLVESFRRESKAKVRRHRFQSEMDAGDAFHVCKTCGATEKTHPQAEFRIAADGEEYCDACRKPGAEA